LDALRRDSVAGLVLGIESVPDGLAQGLVAGVNPVFGLYAYLYGMVGAAFATSSIYMTVQATGAMSLVVSDVAMVHSGEDADRALFTLAIMTGIVMVAAGLFKLGSVLRFVANSVMVGFMSAVGINIVLGQLTNFTGYEASGGNRITRTLDLLLHPLQIDLATFAIGLLTIALIVGLERTPLGSLGMVVAIVVGSAAVVVFGLDVLQLGDFAEIPSGLPLPAWPLLSAIPDLIIPAISLSFVGLVQGAGITASFPNPDGTYPDASRDFLGQGVGNIVSGVFRGMPVGGSTSATALISEAGMVTNMAKVFAGLVMVVAIVFFSSAVSYIAMPALAALLIVIGVRTVKPKEIVAVWRTGPVQRVVMASTLILTIIIPLQYAVLVGVAFSMILYIIRSSSNVVVKRLIIHDGDVELVDAPAEVGADEVVILQLYGSIFFASAATYEQLLPRVTPESRNSVVVLRLRGKADLGGTFMDLLGRYAKALRAADSRLVVMSVEDRVLDQLEVTGAAEAIGRDHIYPADDWLGRELRSVATDSQAWIDDHRAPPASPH
jgi:SulP family sulfate permease